MPVDYTSKPKNVSTASIFKASVPRMPAEKKCFDL